MTLDVAIIGAGMAGLAAGIRLAHFGKKVCIFERHTVWGGLNSFYKKDGFHFDTGLHAVTNFVTQGRGCGPRPPLERLCRQLRIRLDDLALEPQSFSRIEVAGARLDFENGLERLTAEISRLFPSEVDGFVRLARDTEAYPDPSADRPFVSARRRLSEYLRDPLLAELLLLPLFFYGASSEDDLDFDLFTVLFNSIYREGFGRPRRGIRQILEVLVKRFEEAGGELRRRAGVSRLEVSGGRVSGLVLDSGERVEVSEVLSTAGLVETERLRTDRAPDALQDRTGRIAFNETVFVLDRPAREVGFEPCVTFYCRGERLAWRSPPSPLDLDSGVICAPGNYLHAEPLETHQLRVTHLSSAEHWRSLEPEVYASEKARWIERSRLAVLPHTGDFSPSIRYVDGFTPRTVQHYTGHLGGAVYGSPYKQKTGGTDLANLHLAGTDQGLLGIVGAMLSGVAIANQRLLGAR